MRTCREGRGKISFKILIRKAVVLKEKTFLVSSHHILMPRIIKGLVSVLSHETDCQARRKRDAHMMSPAAPYSNCAETILGIVTIPMYSGH